ncbi:LuxR family transcriptional regulator [Enterobacter asburiae]|nr:LuxR family transcriptional regulator [Enterobacter asburiae]
MKGIYYNDITINTLIKNELDAFFKPFKGCVFAYAIMNKKDPSQMQIINNSPEWFDIYLDRKYQFIDPVIIRALRCVEDFFWESDAIQSDGYNLTRIFNESVQYDIYQGQTFPLHDYLNNLVVLSIISPKSSIFDIIKCREKTLSFLIQLHQRTLNLYSHHKKKKNVFLSPREQQILKWVSAGKTYSEISVILSISEGTVKFHVGNVIKKFGVNNAKHAIKLGTELRLLDD